MAGDGSSGAAIGRTATETFMSQAAVAACSLIHVVVIARALGPAGRGQMVYLTTIAGLTGYAFAFGGQDAIGNLAGVNPGMRSRLASSAVVLAAGLGVAGLVIGFVAAAWTPTSSHVASNTTILLAMGGIPPLILQTYLGYLARAAHAHRVANLATVAGPVFLLLGNASFAATSKLSLDRAVAMWTFAHLLTTCVLVGFAWRTCGFSRTNRRTLTATMGFGMKAHGAAVFSMGNYKLDQWILGAVWGPERLGIYSVAVAIFEGLFILPTAVSAALRPSLVRLSKSEAFELASLYCRRALAATVCIGLLMVVAAPKAIELTFGAEYADSALILRILVPGALGIVVVKVLGSTLTAQGRPLLETVAVGISFAVGAVLYGLLIPVWSERGAAFASATSYIVGAAATYGVFRIGRNGDTSSRTHRSDLRCTVDREEVEGAGASFPPEGETSFMRIRN